MADHDNACPMASGVDEPDNPGLVCECQTARRARADERGRADSECPHLLEAATLAAENIRLTTELDALRDGWGAWVCSDEIAKVLDALRTEVLGLEHEDECVTRWQPRDLRRKKRPCDCLIADVITKIEEVSRD